MLLAFGTWRESINSCDTCKNCQSCLCLCLNVSFSHFNFSPQPKSKKNWEKIQPFLVCACMQPLYLVGFASKHSQQSQVAWLTVICNRTIYLPSYIQKSYFRCIFYFFSRCIEHFTLWGKQISCKEVHHVMPHVKNCAVWKKIYKFLQSFKDKARITKDSYSRGEDKNKSKEGTWGWLYNGYIYWQTEKIWAQGSHREKRRANQISNWLWG